jgi:serine/threonine protein phosphatase PrpC
MEMNLLDNISPSFRDNLPCIESITFRDPPNEGFSLGQSDDGFASLQLSQLAKSSLGCAYANNYPRIIPPQNPDPQLNCDAFYAAVFPDYRFSIVTDGCGLGARSREAAQRAVFKIVEHLTLSAQSSSTGVELVRLLVKSFAEAHADIFRLKERINIVGSTTVNLSFAFRIEDQKYLFVVNLGDCMTYIFTEKSDGLFTIQQVHESRRNTKEPGGRLGMIDGTYNPDLNNLSVTCLPLSDERHIIVSVSDGVSDNFNPEKRGLLLNEVDDDFESTFFLQLFQEGMAKGSLNEMCAHVINDGITLTAARREYMENNPSLKREPPTIASLPGKIDHSSIVAFEF